MFNITLLSLSILTQYSISPLHIINIQSVNPFTSLFNSYFSHSFSTIILSKTDRHSTTIQNDAFLKIIDTPLIFQNNNYYDGYCQEGSQCCISTEYNFQHNDIIKNQTIQPSGFPQTFSTKNAFFLGGCGNITISECKFLECHTDNDFGGGLLIEQYCDIKLHSCLFDKCYSARHGSGASLSHSISVEYQKGSPQITYKQTNDIYIQYCCFSNCYATKGEGFGSAIMMSGKIVRLFYASTTNCPGQDHKQFWGAQFDMNAINLSSQFVNATGGKSNYCGAMEYRDAMNGFFQFQTVLSMNCKYAISFTDVDINGLKITTSNVNSNTIHTATLDDEGSNPPALVFVQKKNLVLENFFFYNNNFGDKGVYAAKENVDNITITLINCYSNNPNRTLIKSQYITILNCHFADTILATTEFDLLQLGDCQGEKKPGPIILSSFFTPSNVFTKSSTFSNSDSFTSSKSFTSSSFFTASKEFSQSDAFTDSVTFSRSNHFTSSNRFTSTKEYTQSDSFTHSDDFSPSKKFSSSVRFSSSSSFTESSEFTASSLFTRSRTFTPTGNFSSSQTFTPSDRFTSSVWFSSTLSFTESPEFSASYLFTRSRTFTPTGNFSSSQTFTPSDQFTSSSLFSMSDELTKSFHFTSSELFSPSLEFTPSLNFTSSRTFTPTGNFPHSSTFTATSGFNESRSFSPSEFFTCSKSFSKSRTFTPTVNFTSSKSFTPSSHFTMSSEFTSSDIFACTKEFKQSNSFSRSTGFSPTGNFTNSPPFVVIFIPTSGSDSSNAKQIGMIVGISAASAAAVGGIIAGVVIFAKRTNLDAHEGVYIKMKKNNDAPKTMDNPLADMMGDNDDPFEDDFNIDDLD